MTPSKAHTTQEWFLEMQRSFDSGQYSRAGELYDARIDGGERPANDAILLRARTYLKVDSKQVVPFLLRHELERSTPTQQARRAMYLGTGYSRLGDFAEADRSYVKAKTIFRDGSALGEL